MSTVLRGRPATVVAMAFNAGAKVRVSKSIEVFHVGKFKNGLDLKDRIGTVVQDVSMYEGKELSATLPYKVEFSVDEGDTAVKVLAHLEEDELESVSSDPLEAYCADDPSADECRVYE